jgi:hypothetical protein
MVSPSVLRQICHDIVALEGDPTTPTSSTEGRDEARNQDITVLGKYDIEQVN